MPDNLQFLHALIDGDTQKIDQLYQENFPTVRNFVIQNKGTLEDAEDIFQKALLQLAMRFKKEPFAIHSSFEAYLFTVCKNLWRRELNKSKRQVTNQLRLIQEDEGIDMALAILEQKRWELFQDNLRLLSENCQKILKLFFEKTSYAKMIQIMGYASETVARQRVFKCKSKLKQLVTADKRFPLLKTL